MTNCLKIGGPTNWIPNTFNNFKKCLGNNGDWPPMSRYIVVPHRPLQDVTADNRCFTERRKKTVRFDQHDGRQGSQDSHRDSGIDTSSTFTSSEDSSRGDLPKVYTNPLNINLNSLRANDIINERMRFKLLQKKYITILIKYI